ncbi:MAG: hypothetical protein ABIB79_00020 [archaeon]
MGKEKHLKKIEALLRKSPLVSYSSIQRIVNNKRNSGYTKQLVRNLIIKGKTKRLTNGFYTIHEDPSLIVLSFNESYLGLQDSLSYHNLWDQETIPIIVTSKKIRQGIRKVLGANVLIRRIDKKYFFGFNLKKDGDFYFPYSDIEKTFIDMVYFKENIPNEAMKEIKNKIDKNKLEVYLKRYPLRFRHKVKRFLR